jgi:alcohol dehydrogenase (cytochrome c)
VPSAGDYIFAADAKTGDLLWEYKRKLPEGVAPKRTRTLAIWGNLIINSSSDNYIYALNAQTGQLAWETPVLDPRKRAPTTGGPIIANGKVAGGLIFGGDSNGRFKALDDKTGKVLWEINLGSSVSGYPVSFAVGGKQYVAAITGASLEANSTEALTPELKAGREANVFVFALP